VSHARPAGDILLSRVGLDIPADLRYDRWERAGYQLAGIVESSAWCLGDWLVYGKQRFADRYQRAIQAASLDYQTLRNYAWVARRFEMNRRRENLSFQHHAEVASLPVAEQDHWLECAEKYGWTRNQLRRQVRNRHRNTEPVSAASLPMPRLRVPTDRFERWREAADQTGTEFDRWIVKALDRAAEQSLVRAAGGAAGALPREPSAG
jgi:hypothetical protein